VIRQRVLTLNSISSFILIDLVFQVVALQRYAAGWSKEKLILWLKELGKLEDLTDRSGYELFLLNLRKG
jgi:hypothetical protein